MMVKRIYLLALLIATTMTLFTSCSNSLSESHSSPNIVSSTPLSSQTTPEIQSKNNFYEQIENKIMNAKKIDDINSWIESTTPADNAIDVNYSSSINVKFKYDMDETSLNENNIIVQEAKHNSIISKLFNFNYNKETRTLKIDFKVSGNGYGTSNSVLVLLSRNVKSCQNEQMGIDVKFGFMTK